MAKAKFERTKPHVNIGTIGHVDHGKTTLDHDETIGPDYSQIVPQQFELTTDPAVAGFERIPNVQERVRLLFKRFKKEAEEADAVEVVQPQEPIEHDTHAAAHPSY